MAEYQVQCPVCGAMYSCLECDCADEVYRLREDMLGVIPGVLTSLIKLVDRKDRYTHEHSVRVTEYSLVIASLLELDFEQINVVKRAAKMHDIGKLWISEQILKKPGVLTDEEFAEVKKHPEMGVEIISSIASLSDIKGIILAHHERWDGTGYPIGLRGEQIPLIARIINVADTIDAMSLDRVYRVQRSREEILNELRKESGRQFDPEIIRLVISSQMDIG